MTASNIDLTTDLSDPRTDGELWDNPFTTVDVNEAESIALEKEMAG